MIEFFTPISKEVAKFRKDLPNHTLGKLIDAFVDGNEFPDVQNASMAIVAVLDTRSADDEIGANLNPNSVRKELYKLYKGNWDSKIVDLGDVISGHRREDSRYALKIIVEGLVKLNVIPIILGGSQDLVYGQYRAYDGIAKMVTVVNIDSRFDIGDSEAPMANTSYVGKMIVDEPFNLHHYAVLGYQSFFNPPEEIALMDKLYFDAYRLGEVTADISIAEPVLRNADVVCLDISAIKSADLRCRSRVNPNGFDGREICALARYAGISNRVSSFGIYEIPEEIDTQGAILLAQILWYFMEGVNFRIADEHFENTELYTHYVVPLEEMDLTFIRSNKSDRWWMELPFLEGHDNKFNRHTLLPCTKADYLAACNQEIPERWLKARLKNEINL